MAPYFQRMKPSTDIYSSRPSKGSKVVFLKIRILKETVSAVSGFDVRTQALPGLLNINFLGPMFSFVLMSGPASV